MNDTVTELGDKLADSVASPPPLLPFPSSLSGLAILGDGEGSQNSIREVGLWLSGTTEKLDAISEWVGHR